MFSVTFLYILTSFEKHDCEPLFKKVFFIKISYDFYKSRTVVFPNAENNVKH